MQIAFSIFTIYCSTFKEKVNRKKKTNQLNSFCEILLSQTNQTKIISLSHVCRHHELMLFEY